MNFGEDYDSFKDLVDNNVDVFQDSTFHINGVVGDDSDRGNVDDKEGTKTAANNETPETSSATFVGMTNSSEHDCQEFARSFIPNGNRRLQNRRRRSY